MRRVFNLEGPCLSGLDPRAQMRNKLTFACFRLFLALSSALPLDGTLPSLPSLRSHSLSHRKLIHLEKKQAQAPNSMVLRPTLAARFPHIAENRAAKDSAKQPFPSSSSSSSSKQLEGDATIDHSEDSNSVGRC